MCRLCDFAAVEMPGARCPTHGEPLVSPGMRGLAPIDERYIVIDALDEGAFAEVSLAFDRQAPAEAPVLVAIKQLKRDQRDPEVRARFRREGDMLRRLAGHDGIVGLRGSRHDGDTQYLALEYVAGLNLEGLIAERRRLPTAPAVRVVLAVLDALEHLHERGVIHRDLKPNNIMVQAIAEQPGDPTTVKLLDLGIARRVDEQNAMLPLITRRGWTVGTPFYMAPEQFDDSQVDARADIYAAGVVLFHLLSGHAPFQGSGHQVAQKHRGAPIPELDDALEVPVAVESAMRRAMAKAPERRYGTARSMYAALASAIGEAATGRPRATSRLRSEGDAARRPDPVYEDDTLEVTDPELLRAVAAVSAARATMSGPAMPSRDLMHNAARRPAMPIPTAATLAPVRRASSTARFRTGDGMSPDQPGPTGPSGLDPTSAGVAPLGGPGAGAVIGLTDPPSPAALHGDRLARSPAPALTAARPAHPQPAHPHPAHLHPANLGPAPIAESPTPSGGPAPVAASAVRAIGTLRDVRPDQGLAPAADPAIARPTLAEPTRGRGPLPWRRAGVAAAVTFVLGLGVNWAIGGEGVAVWSSTALASEGVGAGAAAAPLEPAPTAVIRAFRALADVPTLPALAAAPPPSPPRANPAPRSQPRPIADARPRPRPRPPEPKAEPRPTRSPSVPF